MRNLKVSRAVDLKNVKNKSKRKTPFLETVIFL